MLLAKKFGGMQDLISISQHVDFSIEEVLFYSVFISLNLE